MRGENSAALLEGELNPGRPGTDLHIRISDLHITAGDAAADDHLLYLEARAEPARQEQEEEDDEEAELERSEAATRAERTRQEKAELERSEAAARAERTRQEEEADEEAEFERSEAAARAPRARQEEALTVSETGVATAALPILKGCNGQEGEVQSTPEPIPEVQSTVQSTLESIPEGGRGRRAASACVLSSPCLNQLVVRWEARRVRRYRPRSAPPPGSMRVPSFSTRPRSIPLEGSGGQEGIPPEPPPGLTR